MVILWAVGLNNKLKLTVKLLKAGGNLCRSIVKTSTGEDESVVSIVDSISACHAEDQGLIP